MLKDHYEKTNTVDAKIHCHYNARSSPPTAKAKRGVVWSWIVMHRQPKALALFTGSGVKLSRDLRIPGL